jgi:hypothetical protein
MAADVAIEEINSQGGMKAPSGGKLALRETDAGPYNLINLHLSIGVDLGAGWSLGVASVFYWRESPGDGITPPAISSAAMEEAGRDSSARRSKWSSSTNTAATWGFLVSCSQVRPGRYINDTGPSETVHFVGTEIEFRF